jgi:hypothetical protein
MTQALRTGSYELQKDGDEKTRNPLLVVDYAAIYAYNYSISNTRSLNGLPNNVLGLIAAASSYIISRDFISFNGRSLMVFHGSASTNDSDIVLHCRSYVVQMMSLHDDLL